MAKSLCWCFSSLDLVHSPQQILSATISRKVILLIDRSPFIPDLCWTVSEVLCWVGSPLSTWLWQKHAIPKRESSPVLGYISSKMHGFLDAQLELFAGLYFVNIWYESTVKVNHRISNTTGTLKYSRYIVMDWCGLLIHTNKMHLNWIASKKGKKGKNPIKFIVCATMPQNACRYYPGTASLASEQLKTSLKGPHTRLPKKWSQSSRSVCPMLSGTWYDSGDHSVLGQEL